MRAVADLAGMPNWDWVPDAEVAPHTDRCLPQFAEPQGSGYTCKRVLHDVKYHAKGPGAWLIYSSPPSQQWQWTVGQRAERCACWHHRKRCTAVRWSAPATTVVLQKGCTDACPVPVKQPHAIRQEQPGHSCPAQQKTMNDGRTGGSSCFRAALVDHNIWGSSRAARRLGWLLHCAACMVCSAFWCRIGKSASSGSGQAGAFCVQRSGQEW